MTSRVRSRTGSSGPGSFTRYLAYSANTVSQGYTNVLTETCADVAGSRLTDNPLLIERKIVGINPLNQTIGTTTGFMNGANWTRWIPSVETQISHLSLPSVPSDAQVATTVLARTNPSRASVSLPNFIFELKDLPRMIRDIGNIRLRLHQPRDRRRPLSKEELANHYLAGVMGWTPLYSDLRKLVHFQDTVDRRVAELERLYANGGLRRTVGQIGSKSRGALYDESASSESLVTIDTQSGNTLQAKRLRRTTRHVWATVRWKPTTLPSTQHTSADLRRLARKLAFSTSIGPLELWNAMPWSWMIDWYTNIGDFLGSYSNAVPATPGFVNIMTHTETQDQWIRTNLLTIRGGDGTNLLETKSRVQAVASLSASIPFLGSRQLSILGALAVQRFSR